MVNKSIAAIFVAVLSISSFSIPCLATCPSADLNGDCFVDFADFTVLASQWDSEDFTGFAMLADQWLTGNRISPSDMVLIPAGTFQMGDSKGEGPASTELPVHTVTLSSFYIGKYDITNQQYCNFLNSAAVNVVGGVVYASTDSSNSYPYCDTSTSITYSQIAYSGGVFSVAAKGSRSMVNDPMIYVSWYGAAAYCNWRSQQEGKEQCYDLATWACDFTKNGYHLPTDAQCEYAARGGLSGNRFPWGDTITHCQANYDSYWLGGHPYYSYDISPTQGYNPTWSDDEIEPYTSPVGSFAANGYGLCDMAGNVFQWCNDWYLITYYSSSPQNDPTGPTYGFSRVLRGGSYNSSAVYCRVSYRISNANPDSRYYGPGFRVSME